MIKHKLKKLPPVKYILANRDKKSFYKLTEGEINGINFYQQFIEPNDLVFDVGANMGSRTKIFLNLKAKVVAFEPQKVCADFLKLVLKDEENFQLVELALGTVDGVGEMFISDSHTISTLSEHWTKATKESGRFENHEWNEKQDVKITTLDNMINKFGIPRFIKIDVEGYEYEVLSGLTKPISYISIEFAAESIENTFNCIDYLGSISPVVFQFSDSESMDLQFPDWISDVEIKQFLMELVEKDAKAWGDVYIKSEI